MFTRGILPSAVWLIVSCSSTGGGDRETGGSSGTEGNASSANRDASTDDGGGALSVGMTAVIKGNGGSTNAGANSGGADGSLGDASSGANDNVDGGASSPCNTDNGGCDPLASCTTNGITVTCGSCPSGYDDTNADGTDCTNIDECAGNPCDSDGDLGATCVEGTPGNGYSCTCSAGHAETAGASPTCSDFDACSGSPVCTAGYPCQDLAAPSLNYTCRGQFADWAVSDSPNTFTVNDHLAEDTVTDSRSGLEWQQAVNANTYNWEDATTYCTDLVYGSFSDWRLPTRAELESIVDFTQPDPVINGAAFPSTLGECFWSSSSYAEIYAWNVHFGTGYSQVYPYTSTACRVRCVRSSASVAASSGSGGAPPGRYTDNLDGTVSDTFTGLIWQQTVSASSYMQAGAINYCASLSLGGNSNWRLPQISELLTIVDPTQYSPSLDPTAFPSTPAVRFWSSSVYVAYPSNAMGVHFSGGFSQVEPTVNAHRARCVR